MTRSITRLQTNLTMAPLIFIRFRFKEEHNYLNKFNKTSHIRRHLLTLGKEVRMTNLKN